MSPFPAVTGNRMALRNLQIREEQQPSDGKSHPLDLSLFCAKSFCCSDDSWKNQYFMKSSNPSLSNVWICLGLLSSFFLPVFFLPFRMKL